VGDRVTMAPMWKYDDATGTIIKIITDYVVVSWDEVMGQWHYTHEQAVKLQPIEDEK
tara:strand:- start:1926 stop:2096 length:171 start_codon:yes stop_codon:yes gene_type:complete